MLVTFLIPDLSAVADTVCPSHGQDLIAALDMVSDSSMWFGMALGVLLVYSFNLLMCLCYSAHVKSKNV